MITRLLVNSRRLPIRLVLSFTLVVTLSALLVGVPALFLIEGQLTRQAEARLTQGASATRALYDARRRELLSLATLTAQRPTLYRLLEEEAWEDLPPYLEIIREATEVDLLLVTSLEGDIVAHAPPTVEPGELELLLNPLLAGPGAMVDVAARGEDDMALMVGRAPVQGDGGVPLGVVVEGIYLDDNFLSDLGDETGLYHALFAGGERLASSLPLLPARLDGTPEGLVWLGNEPFYLHPLPLVSDGEGLVDLIALPAGEMVATRTRVLQILGGSTLLVTALATLLAYLLARHVTAPLRRLVQASEAVGRGDLATPIPPDQGLVEVTTLANTLEQMRRRLQAAYEELQRAKQWHEELLASLTEGVVTVDESGRITSFSRGAEHILGWKAREVIGRPYSSILPEGSTEPPDAPADSLRQEVRTREGNLVTLRVTRGARTLHVREGWEQAYVFRDVTEQERAAQLREFLLANVSHEFKTPLTALRAAVELLATELPAFSQQELQELADSIWQGTLRLEELVDNLLSSASLRAGHFVIHPRATDLEVLIEEVLLATRPLLMLKGQYLRVDAPSPLPPVHADPRRVHQVLINLISNASKYGPADAAILVSVSPRAEDICIRVRDHGPGIEPEVRQQLFRPFARPRESEHGGLGLGLSIVRAIVERHGGNVGVDSEVGAGATFWFTLPYAPESSGGMDNENSPGRR